jgi:alcohol dehydrogenase
MKVKAAVLHEMGLPRPYADSRPLHVAVIGLGGVGLNALLGCLLAGADGVIAIDRIDRKLDMARQLGATDAFNADDPDAERAIKERTGGGVDFAFEMAGSAPALEFAYRITRRFILLTPISFRTSRHPPTMAGTRP